MYLFSLKTHTYQLCIFCPPYKWRKEKVGRWSRKVFLMEREGDSEHRCQNGQKIIESEAGNLKNKNEDTVAEGERLSPNSFAVGEI